MFPREGGPVHGSASSCGAILSEGRDEQEKETYSREFKLGAVGLAETSGESMAQIGRNLGITVGCLRKWRRRLETNGENAFPGHGDLPPAQDRLRLQGAMTPTCPFRPVPPPSTTILHARAGP